MVRIASFSVLVAGLLIAVPALFSDAEAGWVAGVAPKSDRLVTVLPSDARLSSAFNLVDVCTGATSGDAESWCRAWHAEAAARATTALLSQTDPSLASPGSP